MALETGTFIDDLVNTNPPGTDPKKEGDDHLRLIKSVLQSTFPDAPRAFHFPNAPAAKTGNYTVVLADQNALITVDASGAARTVTLPTFASVFAGFSVTIQKSDTSVNTVTVDGNGAETINGDTTKVLRRVYEAITVTSDGSDWKITRRGFDEIESIEGANVASAASPNIWEGEGNTHHITGTTTITGFAAAPQAGARRYLIFDAAVLLTDSANLNIQGDANYTTALDDIVEVYAETTTVFKLIIHKKDGTSVVSSGGDVTGPGSSTDRAIALYSGTGGKTLKDGPALGSSGQVLTSNGAGADPTFQAGGITSVSQGDVNTTNEDDTSTTLDPTYVVLGGGLWILGWQLKTSTGPDEAILGGKHDTGTKTGKAFSETQSTSFVTNVGLASEDAGGETATFRHKFISASPPYDLGEGPVRGFVWALIESGTGKVLATKVSATPPWAHNGPTDIRPDFIDAEGRKFKAIVNRPISKDQVDANPALLEAYMAQYQNPIRSLVEVDNAMKNADMDLVPHPYMSNDLTGKTVVLLDPMLPLVERLVNMVQEGDPDFFPGELFHDDKITVDNTAITRAGLVIPAGAMVATASLV